MRRQLQRPCDMPRGSVVLPLARRAARSSLFLSARVTQIVQYLTRKLVGSRPSKANPGSSGLFERATEAAGAAATAPAAATLDCSCLRCAFGDEGRAFWASCLPVRPMKRCMKVYIAWKEEAREEEVD